LREREEEKKKRRREEEERGDVVIGIDTNIDILFFFFSVFV